MPLAHHSLQIVLSSSVLWFYFPLAKCFWFRKDLFKAACDNAAVSSSVKVDFIFQMFPSDIGGILIKKSTLQSSAGYKFRCEDLNYVGGIKDHVFVM